MVLEPVGPSVFAPNGTTQMVPLPTTFASAGLLAATQVECKANGQALLGGELDRLALLGVSFAAFGIVHAQPGLAESESEFLLFPFVTASYLSGIFESPLKVNCVLCLRLRSLCGPMSWRAIRFM